MYYINVFLIYSIIGYIYEIVICLFSNAPLESGFLYGPWTPIYGIGVLLILFIHKLIYKFNIKKVLRFIISLIVTIIVLTGIEFLAGHLLELIFDKVYWDYSGYKFNYGKYICLEVSLIWGIMSIIVVFIHSKTKRIIKKIPKFITYSLGTLFIIDLILTFIS